MLLAGAVACTYYLSSPTASGLSIFSRWCYLDISTFITFIVQDRDMFNGHKKYMQKKNEMTGPSRTYGVLVQECDGGL